MQLMKHPDFGNEHVELPEVAERLKSGWVAWPRSKEEKLGKTVIEVQEPEEVKRRGRPARKG